MIRQQVLEANVELARRGLAPFTFGNASGIDRASGVVVIKPSGVPYESMTERDLVAWRRARRPPHDGLDRVRVIDAERGGPGDVLEKDP